MVSLISNNKNLEMKLLNPYELKMNVNATQILSANYKDKSLTNEMAIEITPKKIVLVALTGMGTPIFTINYNGKTIKNSYLPIPHIDDAAKQALLNFILTYSPKESLQKMLKGSNITFATIDKKRMFLYDDKNIIEITYQNNNPWKGNILLENKVEGYKVKINTISFSKNKIDLK